MDYIAAAFHALTQEVEAQGGAALPDKCMPEEVKYDPPAHTLLDKDGQEVRTFTVGCGHPAKFVSIYEPDNHYNANNSGFVTACAVDDAMGAWPRYENAVKAVDTSYWDLLEEQEDD